MTGARRRSWSTPPHDQLPARVGVLGFSRDGDVFASRSLRDAADGVEAIDVEDGEYEAFYTVEGERLAVSIRGGDVLIAPTGEQDVADLRRRLEDVVRVHRLSVPAADARAVADELLREQWERRWPRPPRWLARRLGMVPPRV